MAIVLDAFASYVGDLLKQVAQDELTLLLGVSSEIASLHERLNSLKDYLADAERRRITDQSVQGWVRKLKDVMYDVTDILDLCHLKAMQRGGVGSSAPPVNISCLDSLLFCLRNPLFAHDIGSHIKALNARLDAICKSAAAFSFLKLEAYEDMAAPRRPSAADRKTDPVLERSAVVGEKIEEDTRTLVKMLTNGKNKKQNAVVVVAVVGTGGIGKTTLAKKVFNDEAIKEAFDKKIWLSVTQDVNEVELLRTAIRSVSVGGASDGRESNKSLLVPTLVDAIRDKRFFLVLDDVWSDRAWSGLLKVPFSHGAAGSRVLVTTRHDAVARGMQAMNPFHHVDKLCPPDAWSLLKKQVVSSEMEEVEIDETLKDIGMEIIDKCGGLPLAVKVMGGLLCKKERRRADWEKILHDSIWSVPQMPDELNYTIYLSYQDLHPCLKQCFLHYSLLPKNVDFFIDTVTSMWISEGFLHGETDDLEQLGEECYKELIYRNLIEPNAEYAGEWVSTMHDVVRSFAQHLARDEALVISSRDEIGRGALKSHKFLRLSIETDDLQPDDEFGWKIIQGQKSLRTLILVGELKINPGDSLITLSSLRTLHIENANCTSTLVESLHQLKHLRYISLKCGDITRLPENIGKMRFLQYLGLVCENLDRLPNSIVKLGQLRYLDLSGTSITSIPRGFCGLTSLRTLYGFPTQVDGDWCSLQELGPLSQLWVLGLSNLENVPAISFAAKARLGEKAHLSYLMLECSSRLGEDGFVEDENGVPAEEQRQIEEVFNALTPPLCIESIEISGHFGEQLPRWMMSRVAGAYERLSMVIMDDLACCNQLPDGLCRLPSLYYFQLTHAPAIKRVGPEFLTILPSSSQLRQAHAFPRLKRMNLIGMVEWEEWEWDQQLNSVHAMPALEELVIENCKLRRLPPGLSSQATALTSLYLRNIQQLNSVESFASLVKLEVYDNPNLESITSLNRLQKLVINGCPKMRILEGVPELLRLELKDLDMEELPRYLLQSVSPRHLVLDCSLEMLIAISTGESGPEWSKLSRVQHVKAYADQGDNERRWHVAKDELNLLFGVSLKIATLHDKLRILKDYLADADRRRITDQSVQGWVTKLKHTIRIKALNARLDAICKSAATFSFLKLESYEDMVAPRRSSVADRRMDTRALVRRLTDGKHKKQDAVMVVAMAIKEASDKKIWLSVTQDVNEVDLLRTAIKSAGGASDGRESNKSLLVLALVDAIRDKRFFLVLDDVWSERSWDNLLKAPFSHGAAGSRLLITTRHDEVTQRMEAMQPFHHVDKLYPQDAWLLLKKQVASSDDMEVEIDDTLKDIGMEIIEKCGGLPLAVKVMGGLLSRREKRRSDWDQVLQDFMWSVPPALLDDAVYLNYQDLHPCLKQCFLHCSLLPKNVVFYNVTVLACG
uniref:Uncharacterized protein n=1 Tax=Oryza glumipatula TaxID=40148 RepID=A0A0D9ZW89_9ORYZ